MPPKKKQKKRALADEKLIVFLRTTAIIIAYCVIVFFVIVNIVSSQNMPRIFFDLANGEEKSIVQLFIQAKDSDKFEDLLPEVKNVFSQHSEEVNKESHDRNAQIDSLLLLLESNPNSPEILYSLHLLYQAEKNTGHADKYLQQARMIDPQIGL